MILVYLAATAYFFALHVLGDTNRHAVEYFWTWDMYPGYETVSVRRIVVARTARGQWVRLLPDGTHRFRLHGEWGDRDSDGVPVPRGYARLDLNRQQTFLHRAVAAAIARHRPDKPDDPLAHIAVVDCYWPVRFNLADARAEPERRPTSSRPQYWRVAAEAAVDGGGAIMWQPQDADR